MDSKINLETLNDRQKIWLSQLSYLDINELGKSRIKNGVLKVSELKDFIDNPKEPFNGNAGIGNDKFNKVANNIFGEGKYPSKEDVINSLINCGLGDLNITNISLGQNSMSSGFQAITFKDSYENVGISYRGSDFDFSRGGARDWLESDMLEYFKNDSTQRKEALKYFDENKSELGKNYLYGHSLGGNLTSHVFVENYNQIEQAFTINGNPINQKLIDTPEKVAAFNDSKKYSCNVVCGDIVSQFKSCSKYQNNINYIKNNENMKSSPLSAHMIQASSFDKDGKFIKTDKKEQIKKMGLFATSIMSFVQCIREFMNEISDKITKNDQKGRNEFEQYKTDLYNNFDNMINEINYEAKQNTDDDIMTKFHDIKEKIEQEEIEKIKLQLAQYNQISQFENNNNVEEIQERVR